MYIELDKYCKEMTREELLHFFTKEQKDGSLKMCSTAFLMRSLIMNELEYCDKYEIRTLRGVWYSAIKPTLDKLGLLEEKDSDEEELKRWDATLSNYVCDLLRKGKLTFSDLGIKDISRQKSNPREIYYNVGGKSFSYKGSVAPYPNILIATEKDTVYSIISSISQLYGCSSISCKGQNSLGAMELIVKGMFGKDMPKFNTIYILTMTDYDPAGYYIAEALEKQVNDILLSIGKYINVETYRIGITPNQLTEKEVLQNMYSPKKANIEKWMEKTGGINGMQKGLELDAFSSSQIREIFVNELERFINVDYYKDFVKESYIKTKVLEAIKDRIDSVTITTTDEFINDIEMKDFDIHSFAKDGQSTLYIEDLCVNDLDEQIIDFVNNNF